MHDQKGLRRLALHAIVVATVATAFEPSAEGAESLKRLLPEQYQARVVAPKRGRVLLVNFWATWCEPCREEMPALVSAARSFQPKDLAVILVSIDSKKTSPAVPAFLDRHKVPFACWLARSPDPQTFIDAVDPKWDGSLPHTIIYDRRGTAVVTLSGLQTEASFAEGVRRALSK